MDIYIPYTYIIKFLPTGQVYYGVSYANNAKRVANPSQFWNTYFTSSSTIRQLINAHGTESFSFQIRKTFNNATEARLWEHKVLIRVDAKNNPLWLNNHNGGTNFANPKLTPEHKEKIAQSNKGKSLSAETRCKISETRKRLNFISPTTGKNRSAETKHKISETRKQRNIVSPFKGKSHSIETKIKCGIQNKGRKLSDENKQKLLLANTGRKMSDTNKKLLSLRTSKAVYCDGFIFSSIKLAAQVLMVDVSTIRNRKKSLPLRYFNIN
jgi:hypothetical protein